MQVSISNTTRRKVPRVPFEKIGDEILGKSYELSLVFCGNSLSRRLNRIYRNKDKTANVLSFPLSRKSGEIFINLSRSATFGVTKLFVHACLHLKGMEHGDKMERREKELLSNISNITTNGASRSSRYRYRKLRD